MDYTEFKEVLKKLVQEKHRGSRINPGIDINQ